ncbi:MAG: hypothetical protein DRR08_29495 [Candidatus Parabeggiatoa sp. nov. 2]|nr:MAG: hypothetical protein B6247_30570 [Beggiatoa sp. 4572_84]RKZ51240.1 MAG: hypothetical protein DRR08_29495 [Gammaproteobacteria bacterium]
MNDIDQPLYSKTKVWATAKLKFGFLPNSSLDGFKTTAKLKFGRLPNSSLDGFKKIETKFFINLLETKYLKTLFII